MKVSIYDLSTNKKNTEILWQNFLFVYFLSGLECVGHSFAYAAHFLILKDVWIWPRELPQQAGALPTKPPISLT